MTVERSERLARAMRLGAAALLLAAAPALCATNLDVRVRSGGQASVQVAPGASVPWEIVGELSDAASDGLALFSIDLGWDGGTPMAPAVNPAGAPITSFAVPSGVNNPQGFGGVVFAGGVRQIGGGQNTLNNSFGPYPVGSVVTGVAQPGTPATLASSTLAAPVTPGTYTLGVTRVVANVIVSGASGVPVWKVEPAGPGALSSLTIQVVSSVRTPRARRARR
jgi:hypothetical protein